MSTSTEQQFDLIHHYQEIKNAKERISPYIHETPILSSQTINHLANANKIFFKCENFQKTGAFKPRGAFNAILNLTPEQKSRGVITHSSGNHAQGVAIAAKTLGIKATIVIPKNAPSLKVEATKGYGANVEFCEPNTPAREEAVNKLIQLHDYSLVHPYDDINIVHGAGTVAFELQNQVKNNFNEYLDFVFVPVGGGGLSSGTAISSKGFIQELNSLTNSNRSIKVICCEPERANDAERSFKSKQICTTQTIDTIADGLRSNSIGKINFQVICMSGLVDDIITVSEEEIVAAMRLIYERMKIVVEPSGAVSLAALLKFAKTGALENKNAGVIISGGNISLDEFFNSVSKSITTRN